MKAIGNALIIFIMIVFICGCDKPSFDGNFHGRVTYQCDGSPVIGLKIYINWVGISNHDSYTIGYATTDNSGYYNLNAEVKRPTSFDYYRLITTRYITPQPVCFILGGFSQSCSTGDNNDNVYIDIAIPSYCFVKFHLRNISPVDSNDIFYGVSSLNNFQSLVGTYDGQFIDTFITAKILFMDTLNFQIRFLKNGIQQIDTSSVIAICKDTSFCDIFY